VLDKKFLEKIRERLIAEEKELVGDIAQLTKQDPLLIPERTSAKIPEFVESARESQAAEEIDKQKKLLEERLEDTRLALSKIKSGKKFGACESCKQEIDRARLEAYSLARYCLNCEEDLPPEEESA